jgi:micrococcal nuclease
MMRKVSMRFFGLLLAMLLVGCGAASRPAPADGADKRAVAAAPAPPTATLEPATPSPASPPVPAAPSAPPAAPATQPAAMSGPAREPATVTRVVDGDTIEVRFRHGAVATVRYIGVDTPETVDPNRAPMCFGKEATARNAELVGGRPVQLERDVSETDRYGRLLRYVWVAGPDGATRMANEELVKWGYAQAGAYPPDVKHQPLFTAAEREARAEKRGLWGACERFGAPAAIPSAPAGPAPAKPAAPTPVATAPAGGGCHPAYPDVCLPPAPPDLDCKDIGRKGFRVLPPDPHRLDSDKDGIGCET